ncbi:HNH endonuclease [Arthrobacter sp. GN70]|uniref:HNH endonuclease n=2 Tax=Arthrobacter TaxID=1663 RepID=A0A4R5KIQ1_9MICC|nr:HNH endonuclease [Arthrobacter sp. GN70]TDF95361.1 HNH endonuclease [Arthrobacter terricola]
MNASAAQRAGLGGGLGVGLGNAATSRTMHKFSMLEAAGFKQLMALPAAKPDRMADPDFWLDQANAAMDALRAETVTASRLFGFKDAADFAGKVEEISRAVEFLQIVAAEAVERTRGEAQEARQSSAAPAWRTGWTEPTATASHSEVPVPAPPVSPSEAGSVDDGYRNAAEFLRARLRISIGEARRRLGLASVVLPQAGIAGQEVCARNQVLAAALSSAVVPSRSATLISLALDRVRHIADSETTLKMEQSLTNAAVQSDPDFVARMAKRWVDAIDQDGSEPSEEELRQRQGAFIRKTRRGLHHVEIFATAEQFETLATVMNTATNPRLRQDADGPEDADPDDGSAASPRAFSENDGASRPSLDRRSRAQKLLDGLVGACGVALSTAELPAAGGLRPQVMVTIDYRELLDRIEHESPAASRGSVSSSSSTFQGPIHPTVIRKIACDADIIPVLLGSESRILDIGRSTRVFPPHIRKAISARDQGCAFPDCDIPAPWCEAHHITYWSQGGTTGTDNGILLCSHHHHVIHKEQWTITMDSGVAWFKPPPHIDPRQIPRRNGFFRPTRI